jgi:starvation-inducible DNA-binding protein
MPNDLLALHQNGAQIRMGNDRTFVTRIDLQPDVRSPLIDLLNQQLADTFDLFSQAKQAHWNVKGAQFYQLHELFDRLAGELTGHADLIAERVTALGGLALGTVRMAAQRSRLSESDVQATDGLTTVDALAARFAALGASTRGAIRIADELGDAATADLLTEVARTLDKALWFLEAHHQR